MIGYLKGEVTHVFPEYCFLNVNGVGYRVFIPESTRRKLSIGQTAMLHTYLNVREDAMLLFGFSNQDDYELFMKLIAVTGIGPKVALAILSAVSAEEFCLAVIQKNLTLLTRIPGIGKKTAERLVLELKDKLAQPEKLSDKAAIGGLEPAAVDEMQEAMRALVALGYSQAEIMPALRRVSKENTSVETMIKAVLRELARGT